jgi:hypothetical protein
MPRREQLGLPMPDRSGICGEPSPPAQISTRRRFRILLAPLAYHHACGGHFKDDPIHQYVGYGRQVRFLRRFRNALAELIRRALNIECV